MWGLPLLQGLHFDPLMGLWQILLCSVVIWVLSSPSLMWILLEGTGCLKSPLDLVTAWWNPSYVTGLLEYITVIMYHELVTVGTVGDMRSSRGISRTLLTDKKSTTWGLWVKFYLWWSKDYTLGDSISDSSEELLWRGQGKVSIINDFSEGSMCSHLGRGLQPKGADALLMILMLF